MTITTLNEGPMVSQIFRLIKVVVQDFDSEETLDGGSTRIVKLRSYDLFGYESSQFLPSLLFCV